MFINQLKVFLVESGVLGSVFCYKKAHSVLVCCMWLLKDYCNLLFLDMRSLLTVIIYYFTISFKNSL